MYIYMYIYILYPIYPISLQFNHTLNLQKPTRHRHRCAARLRRLRRRFLAEHPSRLRWLRRWIPRLVAPWDHVPTADPLPAIGSRSGDNLSVLSWEIHAKTWEIHGV